MEKFKIPIWENKKDYPEELGTIVSSLLEIADREFQIRTWIQGKGPEAISRYESFLSFDYDYSWFKKQIRDKDVSLSREQIEAIIRVKVMWWRFNPVLNKDPENPMSDAEVELALFEHPYWKKICKQAEYALSLIRMDRR